jgi:ATP/maltotriose-dependent transcriptional regulator MalT
VSREAVELARRSGNPAALAYALDGRVTAIANPETVEECIALAEELWDVAERMGDRERMVYGGLDKVIARVVVGDIETAAADVEAMNRVADQLGQPEQLFQTKASESMLALAAGRLAEAEELIPEFFALGTRAQPEMALPIFTLQRHTLCEFRGNLEEIEPEIGELVAAYPARPVLRCVLVHLQALLGRVEEARAGFRELAADDFAALPFDIEWLYGTSLIAEACVLLSEKDSAPVLYRSLAPWSALNAVDHPEGIRGSVARYLGQLAALRGRFDEASGHFENALAMNERMGFRPWLALTQRDFAAMLRARGRAGDAERAAQLDADARGIAGEIGLVGYFSDITQTPSHSVGAGSSSIVRQRST